MAAIISVEMYRSVTKIKISSRKFNINFAEDLQEDYKDRAHTTFYTEWSDDDEVPDFENTQ